jgi:hypothetical protein
MTGAFKAFMREVQREYPRLFQNGEFEPIADLFDRLRREVSLSGVRLSDMAEDIARRPWPLEERLVLFERLRRDLDELGSPRAVCEKCLP